jgi:tRNA(Leu) C34 or U34 (ribose-2'-O)-methylase TrmL
MKPSDKYLKKPTSIGEGIWLYNPKYPHNVGTALRAACCYGVPTVCTSGKRIKDEVDTISRIPREERMRNYSMVELVHHDNPLSILEPGVVPVAIEFRGNSQDLFEFEHPEKALYIFGPEDGSLERDVLTKCQHFVRIDTMECLNLAVAVGTLLYDRACKIHARNKALLQNV